MGLKLLHSADWHLDSPFASFPEEERAFLRREQCRLPGRFLELALREQPDLVLLAGDLFDGSPSRETLDTLKHTLRQLEVPVFLSPGNHDHCGAFPWQEEVWPENVHIFTGGLTSVVLPELNCRVYGAGYTSMDCPPLLEDFRAGGEERYCIAVIHGDPTARTSPYCPISATQVRESGLDYLALGHIHAAGSFRAGCTLCGWPGCPMGRGWDETGEKGVYRVTLEDTASVTPLSLGFPRFRELEAEVEEDPAAILEGLLPPQETADFYRVTLTGDGPVDIHGLKQRFSHIPRLTLLDRTIPMGDLWEDAGEDSLRGTFFRLLKESPDPDARAAAKLARRLLSGGEVGIP